MANPSGKTHSPTPQFTTPTPERPADLRAVLPAWWIGACMVGAAGVVLFGHAAALMLIASAATAAVAEAIFGRRRRNRHSISHAALLGFLVALTLPATAPLTVGVVGALIAVGIGKIAVGGIGQYLWQPALVGRVAVQFIFSTTLSYSAGQAQSAVLTPRWLLFGDVNNAAIFSSSEYPGWAEARTPTMTHAIRIERPVQALRHYANGTIPTAGHPAMVVLIENELPPWEDTLLGTVPGGIGETCSVVLIVAALYLVHRGVLRWELLFGIFAAAFASAAIMPVRDPSADMFEFFPGWTTWSGIPIGLMYAMYHITSGQLLLAATLIAGDPTTSPRTGGGHFIYGLCIGGLTMFMRLYGLPEGEAWWAILIMNAFVPTIDRRTQPVLAATR